MRKGLPEMKRFHCVHRVVNQLVNSEAIKRRVIALVLRLKKENASWRNQKREGLLDETKESALNLQNSARTFLAAKSLF